MINQLCFLLVLLLFHPLPSYTQAASSFLLAQDNNDFDDSVLKDIEDIEVEESPDKDTEEELDEEKEDIDEEDELDEEKEDIDEEEELDEEEEDIDEEEELDEEEEDIDEEDELDEEEEDIDEEEELDEEEEDIDEEDELDEEEEDIDEEDELDEEEEDIDEEDELDEEEDDIDTEEEKEKAPSEEEDSKITLKPIEEEGEALSDEELSLEEEEELLPDEEPSLEEEGELLPDEEPSLEKEGEALPDEEPSLEEEGEALPDEEPSLEEEEEALLDEEEAEDISRDTLNVIENIRYVATEDQIVIDSSEVISFQQRVNLKNRQVIIEILQARLTEGLQWTYPLEDFPNSGFGMLHADEKDGNTVRILIQIKENYPIPLVVSGDNGDQMIVTFQDSSGGSAFTPTGAPTGESPSDQSSILPTQTLEDFYFGKLKFSGRPLSFHVIDAPIKQVLRFISEESGLNMVIDESVKGSITMKLENIPWDQAYHTILKVKDLGYIGQGNVVMISSLDALEAKTRKLRDVVESAKALAPFKTKVIPVSYGKISDIVSKINPFLTKAGKAGGRKGEVITHEESGTLVITDTEKTIKRVEKLISFLDKPPKQVMIEARIVDAVETFVENFGIAWDISGSMPFTLNVSGLLQDILRTPGTFSITEKGSRSTLRLNGLPLIGDLGASLRLAENKGFAKVISSPKVVTISGKPASITRNSPILIPKSVTTNQTANPGVANETLEPLDIKVELTVTPHVTPSGSVFMEVQVTRSSPGPKAGEKGEATSTERSAKTQVLVKNGHTIVIGGIYQYDEITGNEGLPFLRHIPFLKFLFSATTFNTSKSELLVFLTPKLIDTVSH